MFEESERERQRRHEALGVEGREDGDGREIHRIYRGIQGGAVSLEQAGRPWIRTVRLRPRRRSLPRTHARTHGLTDFVQARNL